MYLPWRGSHCFVLCVWEGVGKKMRKNSRKDKRKKQEKGFFALMSLCSKQKKQSHLGHHRRGLERRVGDLRDRQLLVVGLLGRDDGRVRREHEVDARVRDEVGLELGDVHVERAVEAQRGGKARDDLRDQPVEVGVGRPLDVEAAAADVVHGLVVEHDGHVGVLEQRVRREHRVVRLDDGRRDLRRRVHREAELGLLAVVDRQALEQQGAEPGAGPAADGVEDEEALQAGAVVGELADAVEREVNNLLADGVVPAGEVVGRVLFPRDELLRVEELAVGARADLVDDGRLEVEEDAARDVLPGARLGEEGVEGVVAGSDVGRGLAVGLDSKKESDLVGFWFGGGFGGGRRETRPKGD